MYEEDDKWGQHTLNSNLLRNLSQQGILACCKVIHDPRKVILYLSACISPWCLAGLECVVPQSTLLLELSYDFLHSHYQFHSYELEQNKKDKRKIRNSKIYAEFFDEFPSKNEVEVLLASIFLKKFCLYNLLLEDFGFKNKYKRALTDESKNWSHIENFMNLWIPRISKKFMLDRTL